MMFLSGARGARGGDAFGDRITLSDNFQLLRLGAPRGFYCRRSLRYQDGGRVHDNDVHGFDANPDRATLGSDSGLHAGAGSVVECQL